MINRRARNTTALIATVVVGALVAGGVSQGADTTSQTPPTSSNLSALGSATSDPGGAFADLENEFNSRLGVYAIDTGTGRTVQWREDERFGYTSTIKALSSAAVLDDVGVSGLDQEVEVREDDILPNSPVTEKYVGQTLSLGELAEAAVTESDNAAGNYLFDALGGTQGVAEALADNGDSVTTVSREEPELNEVAPGDDRDTSTPKTMAENLHDYVVGDGLSSEEQQQLTDWLLNSQTGDTLVRAGLPEDWEVGDKSGGGDYGTRNDLAVAWPDEGDPVILAVYSDREDQDAEYDDRLIARAATVAAESLG